MIVEVYSRVQACALDSDPNAVMISVSAPNDPAPLKDGWGEIHRLEFHDIVEREEGHGIPSLTLFDEEMADKLWSLIDNINGRRVVVHCDAGISRSVAIGMVIADWAGCELKLHATLTSQFANVRILRLMHRRFWETEGK